MAASLKAVALVKKDIRSHLRAVYETALPPVPHKFQPGDGVYVRRHLRETLQPRWKGPYIVILTTPPALKVEGMATWIPHAHTQLAGPERENPTELPQERDSSGGKIEHQDNPLKLKLRRQPPS